MSGVPTLDFSRFLTGTFEQRSMFCSHLVAGFKKYGFVKLTNHGIPESVVKNLFEYV